MLYCIFVSFSDEIKNRSIDVSGSVLREMSWSVLYVK